MGPINYKLIDAGTAAGSITSAAMYCGRTLNASVQVYTSGTATGTLKVQISNDQVAAPNLPSHWVDVSGLAVTPAATGTLLIPKFDLSYEWIRVVWTQSNAGTGTITVTIKTNDY